MSHELPKAYEPGAIESRWAEYWVKEKLFSVQTPPADAGDETTPNTADKSVRATQPVFTLLLPPPNVTGNLHMGHMFEQTQMDIIVRWHRMRGFLTLWLPGTDHAGIATQLMVERQLATEGKKRRDMGREKFIERVWEWKKQYGHNITNQMKRLGASVDWDREYFTMDENLSRAVREVFVRLYEEELIYRGKYIVNWCPRCETAISDLEVKHEDVAGKLWEIRYPVVGTNEFITVATTRPETMLGDTAIAVNIKDERYTHLHGKKVLLPLMEREIPIITDELAQPEFGTGAVKVTPAHDPNDFQAGLRHNLPQIEVMDENARMNQNAGKYAGLDRYEARKQVIADLEAGNFLVGIKDHTIPLGKCDRCGTVVEPRLSTQWFIKIATMAKRAADAVRSGEITIEPENNQQIYLNWMDNIHDWCISRQLWWGHRIPAWHCKCGEIIVSRETPAKCTKCGGELEQDRDVLDTWFSSGLLPFTTLGWPDQTRDLEVFYPAVQMITGFDILFFWLARMIMFGCHFMQGNQQDVAVKAASGWKDRKDDAVPFRRVYIHALVRDADRQKMSKTKGNVVDPLDVVKRFGTDAVRFTLAAMAAPGTDIAFNESRTEGYRNFANKVWNAARFMFMHVDRISSGTPESEPWLPKTPEVAKPKKFGIEEFHASTLEDRWILSRFNRTAKEVSEALQTFRFHEASNRIYDFFWGDLCDWYLELIKPRLLKAEFHNKFVRLAHGEDFEKIEAELQDELRKLGPEKVTASREKMLELLKNPPANMKGPWREKEFDDAMSQLRSAVDADRQISKIACENLTNLFEASLRLLHPVMPFITEEIWHVMYDGKPPLKSLAFATYPQENAVQIDLAAETDMSILQDLIVSIRNLRAELKVEPKGKVPIQIYFHDSATKTLILQNRIAVEQLANVSEITEVDQNAVRQSPTRGTTRFDVRVIYEKKVDVAAECERLKKELEKIEKETANNQRQLSNEQFLAKAPANVVEGMRKRAGDLVVLRDKTLAQMKELGCK